jgi:hypothetical protein
MRKLLGVFVVSLILLIGCDSSEELDLLVVEESELLISIEIDGVKQRELIEYPIIFSDSMYIMNLIDWDTALVQVESLIVRPHLVVVGTHEFDKSVDERLFDGILRVPVDSVSGTSFSFLGSDMSSGVVRIDSITDERYCHGWFEYEIHHPLEEISFEVRGVFTGIQL